MECVVASFVTRVMVQDMNGMWATSKEHNDQKWNASNLQSLASLTIRYDLVHLVFLSITPCMT